MNRTIKVIISVVLCVWIFAMGLELGSYRERRAINTSLQNNNTVQQQVPATQNSNVVIDTPTTTAPPATQPTETQPAQNDDTTAPAGNDDTTAPKQDEEKPASKIPQTNEEIAAAFVKAMNDTKHTTRNVKAVKNSDVELQVTDCSVSSLTSMVNSIAQRFTGPETVEYDFVNGKAQTSDGEITIYDDLPPSGKDVSLDAAGIASASAEPYGNGGYKLTITIISEESQLGVEPKYHANSVGFLDLASLGLDSIEFTEANFKYSGATVTICVNEEGLLDSYDCNLPMAGTGSGKMGFASASATLEGSSKENWTFTWG